MSLGLVVLEEKLFTRTPMPQSDNIKMKRPTASKVCNAKIILRIKASKINKKRMENTEVCLCRD